MELNKSPFKMTIDLSYPVGRPKPKPVLTPEERAEAIQVLADLPLNLRKALEGLRTEQLDTPYRPEGWTVRQLVHHIADSHMNAVSRFRRPLTEDKPLLRTYDQDGWAELKDAKEGPLAPSLLILEGIHQRLVVMLRSLDDSEFDKMFIHPDWGEHSYDYVLQLYEWHSLHHVAHINSMRKRLDI